jgi:hypothetical protein
MVDLTVVSCLAPCVLGEGDLAAAERLVNAIWKTGLPAVIYVEDCWARALDERFPTGPIRFHETSARRRRAAFALFPELETAWRAMDPSRLPTLDCFIASLTKMGMLHDQSIWNPFGTRHFVWIDADLSVSVHPRYFTEVRALERLPALLGRFLLLARPSAVADELGRAGRSRVQAQLFGGELGAIAPVNARYYQLLEQLLRAGELPTPESLLTMLLEQSPERFDRFVLQDNGLAGALFEEMRGARVAIERTVLY